MANKTTSKAKSTTAKTSTSQKARVEAPATKSEIIEKPIEATKPVVKEIDPDQYITVLNGYQGRLTYKSSRTGEKFKWTEFGAEQEMELRELRNAKNTYKKYFEKNWFMFDDEFAWVIDYLGVGRYYKNAISIAEFDNIFQKDADELKEKIGVDFTYSFEESELIDESGKVQLGDKIVCRVSYNISIIGFGEAIHPISVNAASSGISRVYWK